MSDVRIPSLASLREKRAEIMRILKDLDDKTLTELHRRAGQVDKKPYVEEGPGIALRDGYGTGQSEVSVSTSDVSRPVEAAVVAAAGGDENDPDTWDDHRIDSTLKTILALFEHLGCGLVHLMAVDRKREYLFALDGERRGRESSLQGNCACCDRPVTGAANDRLRGGYCDACRMAWERDGRPGADPQEPGNARARWEADRRSKLAARQAS
jgi:hypothetical protein